MIYDKHSLLQGEGDVLTFFLFYAWILLILRLEVDFDGVPCCTLFCDF